MIKIPNAEKSLEGFLDRGDCYHELEFESSAVHPDGTVEIGFSLQQAPRELGELMTCDADYDSDELDLTNMDGDGSCGAFRFVIAELDEETLESMEIEADEPVAMVFYGTNSAGEYNDDESDAYISGTILITPQGPLAEAAVEKTRQHMIDEINSNTSQIIQAATTQLESLSKFGGRAGKDIHGRLIGLNRVAVR